MMNWEMRYQSKSKVWIGLLLIVFIMINRSFAQEENDLAIANGLAAKEDHNGAIQTYHQLASEGKISLELYYNLANSYLALDSLAQAILYYEKALLINPKDQDVLNNLEIAKDKLPERLTEIDEFFLIRFWKSFYKSLQANTWAWLNIVLGLAILIMVYIRFYRPEYLPGKWWTVLFLTVSFFLLVILLAGYHRRDFSKGGQTSIMMEDVFMKSGPDERSDDIKRLYPGYKLILLDEINGWYKVRTIDREEGWVHPQDVRII